MDGTVYPNTFSELTETTGLFSNVLTPPYVVNPVLTNGNTIVSFDGITVTCSHRAENLQYVVQPYVNRTVQMKTVGFGGEDQDQGWFSGDDPSKGWGPVFEQPNGREPYQFTPSIGTTPSTWSAPLQEDVTNGVYGVHFTFDYGQSTTMSSCYMVVPSGIVQITVYSPRYVFFFISNTLTTNNWTRIHVENYTYPFPPGYGSDGGFTSLEHEYIFPQSHTARYWRAVIASCGTGYLYLHSLQFRGDYFISNCIQVSDTIYYIPRYGYVTDQSLEETWYIERTNTHFVNTTTILNHSNVDKISLTMSIDAPLPENGTLFDNGHLSLEVQTLDFYQTEYFTPEYTLTQYTPIAYSQLTIGTIVVTTTYPNILLAALFTNNYNTRIPSAIPVGQYIYLTTQTPLSNITIGTRSIPSSNTYIRIQESSNSVTWSNVIFDATHLWTERVKVYSFTSSQTRYRISFEDGGPFELSMIQCDGFPTTTVPSTLGQITSLRTSEYTMTVLNANPIDIPSLTETNSSLFKTWVLTATDIFITFNEPTAFSFLDIFANVFAIATSPFPEQTTITAWNDEPLSNVLIWNGTLEVITFTIGGRLAGKYDLLRASFSSSAAYKNWKVRINPQVGYTVFTLSTFTLRRPFVYTNSSNVTIRAKVNSATVSTLTVPKNTPISLTFGSDPLVFVANGITQTVTALPSPTVTQYTQPTIGPFIGRLLEYTPVFPAPNERWHVFNSDPTLTFTFDTERFIQRLDSVPIQSNTFTTGFSFFATVPFEIRSEDFLINSYGESLRLDASRLIFFRNGYTIQVPIQTVPSSYTAIRGTVAHDGISIQIDDGIVQLFPMTTFANNQPLVVHQGQVTLFPPIIIPDIYPVRYTSNIQTISLDLKRELQVDGLVETILNPVNNVRKEITSNRIARNLEYIITSILPESRSNIYYITSSNLCVESPPGLSIQHVKTLGFTSDTFQFVEGTSNLVVPQTRIPEPYTVVKLDWSVSTPRLNGYTFTDVYQYTPGSTYYGYTTEFRSFAVTTTTNMASNSAYYGTFSDDGTVIHSIDFTLNDPGTVYSTFTLPATGNLYLSSDLVTLSSIPTFFYETVQGAYGVYPFTDEIQSIPGGYTPTYTPVQLIASDNTYIQWSNAAYYSFERGIFVETIPPGSTTYPVTVKKGVVKSDIYGYSIYALTTLTEPFTLRTSDGYLYYRTATDTFEFVQSRLIATHFRLSRDTGELSLSVSRQRLGLDGERLCIRDASYFPRWKLLFDGRLTFDVFPGYKNFSGLVDTSGNIQVSPTQVIVPTSVSPIGTHIRYNDRVVPIVSRVGNTYTITDGTFTTTDRITLGVLENVYFQLYYASRGFVIGDDPLYFTRDYDTEYEYSLRTTNFMYNVQYRQKVTYDLYDSGGLVWKTATIDVLQPVAGFNSWIYITSDPQNLSDVTFFGEYNITSYTSSNTSVLLGTNFITLGVMGTDPTFDPVESGVFNIQTYTARYNVQWDNVYPVPGGYVYVFPAPITFDEIRGAADVIASNDPQFINFFILDLPYTQRTFRYYKLDAAPSPNVQFLRRETLPHPTPWEPFIPHQNIFRDNCFVEDFPYTSRVVFRGYTPSKSVDVSLATYTNSLVSNGLNLYTLTVVGDDIFSFTAMNLISFVNDTSGITLGFTRERRLIETGVTQTPLPTIQDVVYTGYIVEDSISTVDKSIYVYTTNTFSYIETSDFPDVPIFTNVQQFVTNALVPFPLIISPNTIAISRGTVDYVDYTEISNGTKVYIQNNTFVRTTYTGSDISIGLAANAYIPGTPITLPNFTSNTAIAPYPVIIKNGE